MDEVPAVVIDNGSSKCKAGFAGDDLPRDASPSIVGRPRYPRAMLTDRLLALLTSNPSAKKTRDVLRATKDLDRYVGSEAQRLRGILSLKHPIERGIVTNWDDMELVWDNVFRNCLQTDPREASVLMTEVPHNPRRNRETMTEIMFESFGCPAFYVVLPAQLAAYASGRCSSFVVDSGHGVTHTMPIWEGHTVRNAILRLDFGGSDVSQYLSRLLLNERGVSLPEEIVREIKEKLGYAALDFEAESLAAASNANYQLAQERTYTLPDGQVVSLQEQQFQSVEPLFLPSLLGLPKGETPPSLPQLVFKGITNCEIDLRRDLFGNVLLSGGNTMFPGVAQRMEKELQRLAPVHARIKVVAPRDRNLSAWIGGSILASLTTFQQMWISKAEYDEDGPAIVHRKCLDAHK